MFNCSMFVVTHQFRGRKYIMNNDDEEFRDPSRGSGLKPTKILSRMEIQKPQCLTPKTLRLAAYQASISAQNDQGQELRVGRWIV